MRLVIKNSIQLCLRTLVFSIVLRHSYYNNRIIFIEGTFLGDTLYIDIVFFEFLNLTNSNVEYSPIITEPEANNCFSIFAQVFLCFSGLNSF
jgi:hypothetical protein